jgi:23S rRNA pseudouridine1911/1915/1917 synthase
MAVFKDGGPATKRAVTHYETLAASPPGPGAVALICCQLETGRTHQIRVHMQALGYPLYGDPIYGRTRPRDPFPRQALHAWKLGFTDPGSGEPRLFTSPPPADFALLLAQLGLSFESPAGMHHGS